MADLEERLRETAARRSLDYEPPADLPDRITDRVQQRRRRNRLVAAGATAAAAAAVVVALVLIEGPHDDSLRTVDSTPATTTTPDQPGTSVTTAPGEDKPAAGTTSSTSSTPVPSGPAIDFLTPLSRQGFGPVTAGMTLRQAQDAAGVTLTPGTEDGCSFARISDLDTSVTFVVEPAGADPMDGIVRAVAGSVMPTDEGVAIGSTRAELLAALGQPTRTEVAPYPWGPDGQLLTFESGGFAYGAVLLNDQVDDLVSGDPAWLARAVECPHF